MLVGLVPNEGNDNDRPARAWLSRLVRAGRRRLGEARTVAL